MLLLLKRRERLRYFFSEFFFKSRRPLWGASICVSETTSKINRVKIRYCLEDFILLMNFFILMVHSVPGASKFIDRFIKDLALQSLSLQPEICGVSCWALLYIHLVDQMLQILF